MTGAQEWVLPDLAVLREQIDEEGSFETGHTASDQLLSRKAMPQKPEEMAIVAVIDHTIPIAHHLLTLASGHSRVASAWLMDAPKTLRRREVAFGQEYRGVEIDSLREIGSKSPLGEDAFYRRIGLLNPAGKNRWLMRAASHGAGVTGMAAGHLPVDPSASQFPLLAVSLPDRVIRDTSGTKMPEFMKMALYFVVSRARMLSRQIAAAKGKPGLRPPLVINISLGVTAGPRDGKAEVDQLIDALCRAKFPDLGEIHIVLASGNTRQQQLNGVLRPGDEIGWQLLPDDRTPSELQVWTPPQPPGSPAIELALKLPGMGVMRTDFAAPSGPGKQVAKMRDGNGHVLGKLVLHAFARGAELRQCLSLIVPPTVAETLGEASTAAGIWQVRLSERHSGPCDLVIQRDDSLIGFPRAGRQSRLIERGYTSRGPNGQWLGPDPVPPRFEIRRNGTLNAYAWGGESLRIGSAYLHSGGDPGYGSLLANGESGDVDAPSDRGPALMGMIAPGNRGRVMQAFGGTSISAPQLTRWLAGELARGAALKDRAAVIAAARADYPSSGPVPCVTPDLPWRVI